MNKEEKGRPFSYEDEGQDMFSDVIRAKKWDIMAVRQKAVYKA